MEKRQTGGTTLCRCIKLMQKGREIMKTALTIAGSDSSGGAGIQADMKTMITNGVYAMSAITALTAQNTTGVTGIMEVSPEFLGQQMDAVFEDIYPDAVKIGMVSSFIFLNTLFQALYKNPLLKTYRTPYLNGIALLSIFRKALSSRTPSVCGN